MTETKQGATSPAPVIWVVDDDSDMRQALAAVLAAAGYQVVQFAGSMPPLKSLDMGAEVSMLVADVQLGANQPHGAALVNMMRMRRPGLPCLLITADGAIPEDIDYGVTLLRKPIALNSFAASVRAVLGR